MWCALATIHNHVHNDALSHHHPSGVEACGQGCAVQDMLMCFCTCIPYICFSCKSQLHSSCTCGAPNPCYLILPGLKEGLQLSLHPEFTSLGYMHSGCDLLSFNPTWCSVL
jgi:hypothetical protein